MAIKMGFLFVNLEQENYIGWVKALTTVTAKMCSSFIARIQSVFSLVLREEDMEF